MSGKNKSGFGPYSICHVTSLSGSDAARFETLRWGFDDAPSGYAILETVAKADGKPTDECIVIRVIEPEEASIFLE